MGGKGGGGGGGGSGMTAEQMGYVLDPTAFGPEGGAASAGYVTQADYDKKYPKAAAPAAAATPAAAAAAAPAAAPAAVALTGDPGPPKNDTLAPSVPGGTDVADPAAPGGAGSGVNSTGDTLGGSVLNPPKYWTGNTSKFKSGSASQGKMTTTQT